MWFSISMSIVGYKMLSKWITSNKTVEMVYANLVQMCIVLASCLQSVVSGCGENFGLSEGRAVCSLRDKTQGKINIKQ